MSAHWSDNKTYKGTALSMSEYTFLRGPPRVFRSFYCSCNNNKPFVYVPVGSENEMRAERYFLKPNDDTENSTPAQKKS